MSIRHIAKTARHLSLSFPVILLLTGCQDSVEERAEAAGCDNLERRLSDLFVRAGRMEQIEIQWSHEMNKYGLKRTPLAAAEIGGDRARAALNAVQNLFTTVGNKTLTDDDAATLGAQISSDLVSFDGDYALRSQTEEYYVRCSSFVGEYIVTDNNIDKLHSLYFSPPS
jgi:hypothetical protein